MCLDGYLSIDQGICPEKRRLFHAGQKKGWRLARDLLKGAELDVYENGPVYWSGREIVLRSWSWSSGHQVIRSACLSYETGRKEIERELIQLGSWLVLRV